MPQYSAIPKERQSTYLLLPKTFNYHWGGDKENDAIIAIIPDCSPILLSILNVAVTDFIYYHAAFHC